jgi:hypothetical protein
MKIRDIVVEVGPVSWEKGKSKMDKVLSPSKWLDGTNAKLQYDKGADKMDKLLTPSRWFEPAGTEKSKTKTEPTDTKELKGLVDQALTGKPLDSSSLQKLRVYRADISDKELGATFDTVLRSGHLDSQDLFALKSYRNTL